MALTKTPIELSSTPGIVDSSNATAITINSSENVGIGVSPQARLHVDGAEDYTGGIVLTAGAQLHSWFLSSDFVNVHNIHTSSASAAHTWQTNGTEKVRITPNGLTFNGDTAAANALDDYEEGVWTGSPTAGSSSALTVTDEKYTKIGNQVTVQCTINFSGASGALSIAGLPFAASPAAVGIGREDATSGYAVYGRAESGSATFHIFFAGGASNASPFQVSSGNMRYSMTYLT